MRGVTVTLEIYLSSISLVAIKSKISNERHLWVLKSRCRPPTYFQIKRWPWAATILSTPLCKWEHLSWIWREVGAFFFTIPTTVQHWARLGKIYWRSRHLWSNFIVSQLSMSIMQVPLMLTFNVSLRLTRRSGDGENVAGEPLTWS